VKLVSVMRLVVSAVVLVSTAAVLLNNWNVSKGNRLIDEANALIDSGNEFATKAGADCQTLFAVDQLAGFPENRSEHRAKAEAASDSLGKAADYFEQAAAKFDAASKSGVDKTVAEYWSLEAKFFEKFAATKRAYRTMAGLWLDESITTNETWVEKMEAISTQASTLDAESTELEKQAEKIKSENASDFKTL
jgi:hypothetical protein